MSVSNSVIGVVLLLAGLSGALSTVLSTSGIILVLSLMGFAGALMEIGLPQGDIPIALLAFNVGVELGQLAFVAAVMACFVLLRAAWPSVLHAFRQAHSTGTSVLGYSIGGVATFWLAERVAGF